MKKSITFNKNRALAFLEQYKHAEYEDLLHLTAVSSGLLLRTLLHRLTVGLPQEHKEVAAGELHRDYPTILEHLLTLGVLVDTRYDELYEKKLTVTIDRKNIEVVSGSKTGTLLTFQKGMT